MVSAAFALPVQSSESWHRLEYSSIPANTVSFAAHEMQIAVNKSASPLIYALPKPLKVTGVRFHGFFDGLVQLTDSARQGEKKFDDYVLRIGLVVAGEKRLNALQKLFAPAWIKRVYENVPPSAGLDSIQFFNFTQNQAQLGQSRFHPSSELIRESFVALAKSSGAVEFTHQITPAQTVVAIWLSSDGDDTGSQFKVRIQKLELEALD